MGLLSLAKKTIDELIELGYPESVAKKIADGTLPMDDASREARASLMNMTDERLYRGHNSGRPPHSNQDMFMSDSHDNAFTYADAFPYGDVTPLRHNAKDLAYVNAGGKSDRAVTTNNLKNPGIRRGVIRGTDDIVEAVKYSDEYQGTHFKGIRDDMHNSSSTERANVYNILGSRPEVKIRHADLAAFDPEYNGPSIMGGAALPVAAGLLAAGQSDDADAGFITKGGKTLLEAWHGSPHKFDKFSMDQIGTGEGAQRYGHGLYFTDTEDIAKQYRDTLSLNGYQDNNANYGKALELGLSAGEFDRFEGMIRMAATKDGLNAGRISKDLQEYLQWPDDSMPALESFVGEYLDTLPKGNLYRTEIDVTPESLLDWDKPLSDDTPQQMKDSINALVKNNPDLKDDLYQAYREGQPGSIYYSLLSDHAKTGDIVKNQQFATQQLNEAGIEGIKYLDGDSRAVGDGTSNYVIFDDSLINIAERGNADPRLLAGTAAGTAGLLAAGQSEEADAGVGTTVARQILDGFDPRFDPRAKEADRIMSLTTEKLDSGIDVPRMALSDLEGKDFVTSMSDRTDAGGLITSINGVDLEVPLNLRGGQDYMFNNPGKVWASGKTPVTQLMNAAGGKDTLFMPWRMAPTGGDFSNMTGEAMLSYARANMDSATKKELDQMIGEQVSGWPGVNSDEAIDFWPTISDKIRKQLKNDMDVRFRDRGGLNKGEARLVVTDPRQINARDGGIMNIGMIHGDKPRITNNDHPSYPDAVPGEGLGRTDQDVGILELLPEVVAERGVPDPLNPRPTDLRALQMKPYKGRVTEEILTNLQKRGVDVRAVGAPTADSGLLSAQLHNHDQGVDQHMLNLGIDPREDPMYDYGTFLPVRENIVTGKSEMAMPSFARDMIRGLLDIAESRRSGVFRPDGLFEVL